MFTIIQQEQLKQRSITPEQVAQQLAQFRQGFPYLRLLGAASIAQGVRQYTEAEMGTYVATWHAFVAQGEARITKFVPASGAASRMFKDLFAFLEAPYDAPTTEFEKQFFSHLPRFAFFCTLNDTCETLYGALATRLIAEGRCKDVVRALLLPEGMDYGRLPKGLLEFHYYTDGVRTPFEEHLIEGSQYASMANGHVSIHYTVSSQHEALFAEQVAAKVARLEAKHGVTFDITFSQQKQHTDTIAVNEDNTPFVNADGTLLFRPGGHGALLANLNELDADIVFVKNIDNVVPDRLKADCNAYKALLGGLLVKIREQIFAHLHVLDAGATPEQLQEILHFVERELCVITPPHLDRSRANLEAYLRSKLHRPIRVAAMVKNVGEAGGGPFMAYNPDGSASLQILESSQIDMSDAEARACFEQGTHFNPVDLVCCLTDYCGRRFDLSQYTDPATGFISSKSKDGRTLRALELPGLWNGAMSDWTTLFVEVPLTTFNPVKTVNDLLRPEHQTRATIDLYGTTT
ncbi:MAG: DUF4301 family protein [Bacteroidales bacterium]|nr:DUF4301 family protein [Bacteroidales bacterium]